MAAMTRPRQMSASDRLVLIGGSDRFMQGLIMAAAPVLFLRYTHNSALVGIGNAFQYSAWLIFGILAGGLADLYDRKTLIRLSAYLRIAVAATATVLSLTGAMSLAIAISIVAILAASLVFTDTALNASMPALFEREELLAANSRLSVVQSVAGVVAPMIATTAILAGEPLVFVVVAAPTIATMLATRSRDVSLFGPAGTGKMRNLSLTAGFRSLLASRHIRSLLFGVSWLNLLSGAFLTVLPVLALTVRHFSAGQFGVALAVKAGALVMANIVVAKVIRRSPERLTRLLVWSFTLRIVSYFCVGLIASYGALIVAMVINGFALALWNIPSSSMVLEASRGDRSAGVIASFKTAATIWTPLGALVAGALIAVIGAADLSVWMGGASAVGALAFLATAAAPRQATKEQAYR